MQSDQEFRVMEHFYTIQGEGYHQGKAAYFVRLGGCDVGCHWCDVKDSWNGEAHPIMSIEEIRTNITQKTDIVVVTGGEPLVYHLTDFTQNLKQNGYKTHIETSGAYALTGSWDWICLSPKKFKLPKEEIYPLANELKCIVYNKHDLKFAQEQAGQVEKHCHLYLQPEWSTREKMMPLIVDFVKENPQWRVTLQTHKYLDVP
jgi:organic radical activating enzyme